MINRVPGIVKQLSYGFLYEDKFSNSDKKTIQITTQNKFDKIMGIIVGLIFLILDKIKPTIRSKAIFGVSAIMKHFHELNYVH